MENCVAPGLDEFDVIIRSCIVFSQSILHLAEPKLKRDHFRLQLNPKTNHTLSRCCITMTGTKQFTNL